jgi:hypothetical protein
MHHGFARYSSIVCSQVVPKFWVNPWSEPLERDSFILDALRKGAAKWSEKEGSGTARDLGSELVENEELRQHHQAFAETRDKSQSAPPLAQSI